MATAVEPQARKRRKAAPPPPERPHRSIGKYERLAYERHERDLALCNQPGGHPSGFVFDAKAGERVIRFVESYCRHFEGEWAGQPLVLEEWQRFVFRCVFGWKRADGTRRFRVAYQEVPRKNGKSTEAAGVANYLTFGDQEPGAQVYSTATKEDQAKIVWGAARSMVQQSPDLRRYATLRQKAIVCDRLSSSYKPLGSDSDTLDGLNPHGHVCDELHAHKDRKMWDVMITAMGARRQPLTFVITTAGLYEPESIGWQQHDHAVKVLDGVVEDEEFFAIIFAADEARVESFHSSQALRQLDILCTCRRVPTIQIAHAFAAACVTHATSAGIDRAELSAALNIPSDLLHQRDYAEVATTPSSRSATQPTEKDKPGRGRSGHARTLSDEERSCGASTSEWADSTARTHRSNPSTDSPAKNTTRSTRGSGAGVESVSASSRLYAWITATTQKLFGGSSARTATLPSVYSETLRQIYSAHSITCNARTAELSESGVLTVRFPDDDWQDPATWAKANPNFGVSVKPDYLRQLSRTAAIQPSFLNTFLRLHLNRWTQQRDRWLSLEQWNACDVDCTRDEMAVRESALEKASCFGAFDLSTKLDITALVLVFPETWDLVCRFFVPADNVQERVSRDRVPYDAWIRDGWLIATPGNVIDYGFIRAEADRLAARFNVREWAFDPWNAYEMATGMQSDGYPMVEVRQGYASLSEASKKFEELVVSGKWRHGGNPPMRWMVSNVSTREDPNGNIAPEKPKRHTGLRIDGVAAAVTALSRAIVAEPDTGGDWLLGAVGFGAH